VGHNHEAREEVKAINPEEVFATPKPERLIQRILTLASNEGDWVLDSFLGSGTTAAVAHKMGRKWIGIELGEHCHTHCLPRLQKVADGTDQGGISKSVKWKGGGGFKYYYLAPSLLKEDKHGNWVIDERYNADMLAAAMAKHEGFKYSPDEEIYWKQGQSTEKDFIFTTTQFVTVETMDKIREEMKPGESLLICHNLYKFDSKTEKDFAWILEDDKPVLKWLRPAEKQFHVYWNHNSRRYHPDFVVETGSAIYMVETKKESDVDSSDVQEKARAAVQYCTHATEFTTRNGGKPWKYVLIPHNAVKINMSVDRLVRAYEYAEKY